MDHGGDVVPDTGGAGSVSGLHDRFGKEKRAARVATHGVVVGGPVGGSMPGRLPGIADEKTEAREKTRERSFQLSRWSA